ncbi:MAG: hypothetical protein ACO2PM_16945 [Pyrobaculum sp.]|jgi:DNA polymerase elongation subunit (family B)
MRAVVYLGGSRFWVGGRVERFAPYFYVVSTGAVPDAERTDLNAKCWDGVGYRECQGRVYRVYAGHPAEVRKLREEHKKHGKAAQAGIPFVLRFSVDKGRPPLVFARSEMELASSIKRQEVNFAAVDVEVHGSEVLIGWALPDGDVKISSDVSDLYADLEGVDFLIGYNISNFDYKYLGANKLYVDVGRPVGIIDLFDFATGGWRSSLGVGEEAYALHEVVRQVGAPPDFDMAEWVRAKMRRGQLTGAELRQYLTWDVKATLHLAQMWLPTLTAVSSLAGVPLHLLWVYGASGSPGGLHEAMLARLTVFNGYVLEDRVRMEQGFSGSKVVLRKTGLFRRVAEYDFHMLYPTAYYEFGADPVEAYECQGGFRGVGRTVCFRQGDAYRYLAKVYKAREVAKKSGDRALDQAVKIIANSAYGVLAKPSGYGLNEHVSAVIFNETKLLFERLIDRLRGIYGDTDSVYVPLAGDPYPDGEVTAAAQGIARELWGGRLLYGGSHFRLKLEGVWDVFIYEKKNYLKWSGEKIEAKGQVFKPSGLPAGWKYGSWRRLLVEFAEGRRCWLEELRNLPPEDVMLEESMDLADFFTASKGEDLKTIDYRKRLPILAKFLAESGGSVYSLKRGARGIVDVRYLFLARGVKHASLVIYTQGRFVRVDVTGAELVRDEGGRPAEAKIVGTCMPVGDVEVVYRTAANTYTALKNVFGNCRQAKLV